MNSETKINIDVSLSEWGDKFGSPLHIRYSEVGRKVNDGYSGYYPDWDYYDNYDYFDDQYDMWESVWESFDFGRRCPKCLSFIMTGERHFPPECHEWVISEVMDS